MGNKESPTHKAKSSVNGEFGKRTSGSEDIPKTPLLLWLSSFTVLMVLYGIRLPHVMTKVREQVPEELAAQENPGVVDLGIAIGGYLFIMVMVFITAVYYVVAAVLNKYLYPSGFLTWGKYSIGYFFFLVSVSTVVPQVLVILCGVTKPQDVSLFWICPMVITAAGLFLYRQCWAGVSWGKKAMVAIISFGFAMLPLA